VTRRFGGAVTPNFTPLLDQPLVKCATAYAACRKLGEWSFWSIFWHHILTLYPLRHVQRNLHMMSST